MTPASRYGDEMKFGPCGRLGGARTLTPTTFAPGQVITVTFDEFINHPGFYRIAFDPAGHDDLAPPSYDAASLAWTSPAGVQVLADRIPDAAVGLTHGEVVVTLPEVECDGCTLQLIQVMTDKPPFDGGDDLYYQCADLVLARTPGVDPPPAPVAPEPAGGCASGGGGGVLALLGLLALVGAHQARRRDAQPRVG
ncbi:MAG: lytic polysaccharide monooxygenase [Anaeromyxobacter sp.]|nr:lytic polysaccharide monooxygenase [Anaeromyxobacter sp.]MBL0275526.1 lytic polysaccharide monooxygenase [Anaeromyxobacter sp.]